MSDLAVLFSAYEKVARRVAEFENASARLELARIEEHCAYLISQHEPVASLKLDRERLRLVLNYIRYGDLKRLDREFEELRIEEAKKTNENP